MKIKKIICLIGLLLSAKCTTGQELSFTDTIKDYNFHRIFINATGKEVVGLWGIANIVAGGIGSFSAKQDEWKFFHEMNAGFGIVNTGMALKGIFNLRKQTVEKLNTNKAYQDYLHDKRKLIINISFDLVCASTGALLAQYGNTASHNQDMYKGFGRSMVIQGIFLAAMDNFLYAAHNKYNTRWLRIMDEIKFTGNGISIDHKF